MRFVHVYPEAHLAGAVWTFTVLIADRDTDERLEPVHTAAAGVTAATPLTLLKVVWDMQIGDTVELQEVDDALWLDDIHPAPSQHETVWGNWQAAAEGIIAGLAAGYTLEDFQAGWSKQATQRVRQDANRALVIQRGWAIDAGSVHQHEGDGTNTDG